MKTLLRKSALSLAIATLAACSQAPDGSTEIDPTQVKGETAHPFGHPEWRNDFSEGQRPLDIMRADLPEVVEQQGEGATFAIFGGGTSTRGMLSEFSNRSLWFTYADESKTDLVSAPAQIYSEYPSTQTSCATQILIGLDSVAGYAQDSEVTLFRTTKSEFGPTGYGSESSKNWKIVEQHDITEDFLIMPRYMPVPTESQVNALVEEVEQGTVFITTKYGQGNYDYKNGVELPTAHTDPRLADAHISVRVIDAYTGGGGRDDVEYPRLISLPSYPDSYVGPIEYGQFTLKCGSATEEEAASFYVAAAAAKVKSKFPELSNKAVLQVLLDTASKKSPYYVKAHGQGVLDMAAALAIDPDDYTDI